MGTWSPGKLQAKNARRRVESCLPQARRFWAEAEMDLAEDFATRCEDAEGAFCPVVFGSQC